MNSHRLEKLFHAALQLPEAERAAFLDRECESDAALLRQVAGLLSMDDHADRFLRVPASDQYAERWGQLAAAPAGDSHAAREDLRVGPTDDPGPLRAGHRLGAYQIVRPLGQGGMGAVYEALQDRPERTVALKILHPAVASERMIRRFEFEADVLGRLRHPGIAQVFDAGLHEEGAIRVPFFAMELIPHARPLTDFAADQRYSFRQRLDLFLMVCDAVHHGHMQGVIHRDLKPANILVSAAEAFDASSSSSAPSASAHPHFVRKPSGSGFARKPKGTAASATRAVPQPKIIDFGLARLVRSDAVDISRHTRPGELLGTPAYMSPEQARGDENGVDVRSDVYALGVVLYEMLTGALPFPKTDTLRAYLAQIIEGEPSRPSSFNARIDDEIETITLTCLSRDPQRRYQSVDQLSADVRRYLSGEPIEAKRDAALYVLRKHLQRYRLPLAVAALFMIVVLTGLFTSLTYWRRAERSATRADEQATRARREANTATYTLDFISGMFLGLDPNVAKGKDPAILRVMLDDAAARAEGELHESPEAQARVYAILGRAYHCIFEPNIAAAFLDKSVTLRRELKIGDDADSLRLQLVSAASLAEQGQFGLASAALEDLYWTAVACHGPEAEVTLIAQFMRGSIRLLQGRVAEGISILEDLCKTAERALPPDHHVREGADFALAAAYQQAGRLDEAERRWAEVYQSRLERYGEDATETLKARGGLAELYVLQQQFEQAEPLLRKTCDTAARLLGAESPETLRYRQTLGLCLRDSGQLEAGAGILEEVLVARRRVLGQDHPETAASLHELGMSRLDQGRPAEAAELLHAALGTYRLQLTETHGSVVAATTGLAQALIALTRFEEAQGLLTALRQAVEQDAAVPAPFRCAVARAFVRLYEAWSTHRGDLSQSLQEARDAAAQGGCD